MDSFTVNKIAGAVLGTCLFGMGLGILGEAIYFPGAPKKPGYALPELQETKADAVAQPAETPLPVLLAKADATKGEADAKVCTACHNFEEGAGTKVGPDLYGVVDRPKGSVAGFDYSAGLKAKGGNWTYADINQFLIKPSAYVSGTKMGYAGQESAEKRADILAYLRTLSKQPVPLPPVTAADTQASAGGGAAKGAEAQVAKAEVEADKGGGDKGAADKGAADNGAGGDEHLLSLIATADPKKGQANAQVCSACHNFKEGAGALVGPDLYGVVDRPKGSVAGFDYSAAMKAKGGQWTYADLNQFLIKPQAYVKGTKMGYTGEANEKKRAEIIAYLRTLAKEPAPLPQAGAEAKPGDAKPGAKPNATQAKAEPVGDAPLPTGAKPGSQSPPPPPNKPGAAQPVPTLPEPSSAAGAPTQPDSAMPPQPKDAQPKDDTKADAKPATKAELVSPAQAAPATSGSAKPETVGAAPADDGAKGPEPYSAPNWDASAAPK